MKEREFTFPVTFSLPSSSSDLEVLINSLGGGGASFETNTLPAGRVIKITLGEEWVSLAPSVKSQCYAQCKKGITYAIAITL